MIMLSISDSIGAPSWSSVLVRGVASIVFGVVAFAWPGVTLAALVLLFGVYAFVDGVSALAAASRKDVHQRGLLILDGLFGIAAAAVTLFWPKITLLSLVFIVGIRFILSGAIQMTASVQLKHELRSPVLYGLAGVASVILGALAFIVPGITALVLVTMLAIYAIIFGVLLLVLAARLRATSHDLLHVHA
jgi:uncharacterized membrane protein HdeD (DUF308 family)